MEDLGTSDEFSVWVEGMGKRDHVCWATPLHSVVLVVLL
jgi:hypothetical protein